MRKPQAAPHSAERSPGSALAAGPVEDIAQAYLTSTDGDAGIALRCAITDALSDLMEAERRARENSRLISRGFVRSAPRW